jgi:hypothetical protein
MIFSGFFASFTLEPNPRNGSPASCTKNVRLAIFFSPELDFSPTEDAQLHSSFSTSPASIRAGQRINPESARTGC